MVTLDDHTAAEPGSFGGLTDQALYRALVDCFPDVTVFVFGRDLRYLVVTGAALNRLGWQPHELIGRRPSEILPGPDGVELEHHQIAALAGEVRQHEHGGIKEAGAIWSSTIAPVRSVDGSIVAGMIVSRNIADMRAAERARRESEERFAVALEAAPVLVFSQDAELRFTWTNKTVINPSPESILGKTDDEVLPAQAAAATVPAKQEVLRTGKGQRILFEAPSEAGPRFFDMTIEPTHDDLGQVNGLVGAALDVTDLRTSEQRLLAALEAMLDSVTVQQPVTDADGSVVDFLITFATSNARDFAGRGRDELVGRTISELYPALDREFIETYVRVLRSGEPLHVSVFPYVDDAGTTRLYDLGVSRVGEELLVVWRDITDRESQRSATARAEAIRAMSEQLQRGLLPPAPPDVPGLRFAATYRPASETAEVGGDWYAVVELADHGERAVDVVVGDVEGHDGAAAALMARLSTVVAAGSGRALAPHAVLEDVHSFHATLGTERLASVLLARVFPESGRVLVVSAGHPAPLLWRADGSVSRLAVAPGPPVGTQNSEAPTAQLRLSSGDTLVLFSDGLLDPQLDTDDAYAALVGVIARQQAGSLQALVDVLAETTRTYAPSDDVVVMAVRLES